MDAATLITYYIDGVDDRVDAIVSALRSVIRGRASAPMQAAAAKLADVTDAELDSDGMPRRGVLSIEAVRAAEQALIDSDMQHTTQDSTR